MVLAAILEAIRPRHGTHPSLPPATQSRKMDQLLPLLASPPLLVVSIVIFFFSSIVTMATNCAGLLLLCGHFSLPVTCSEIQFSVSA